MHRNGEEDKHKVETEKGGQRERSKTGQHRRDTEALLGSPSTLHTPQPMCQTTSFSLAPPLPFAAILL